MKKKLWQIWSFLTSRPSRPLPLPVSVDNQATSSQPVFLTACTRATLHISPCHHVRCTLLHTFTTQCHYQLPTILRFHPFIDKRENYRPEVLCDQCSSSSSSSRCVHLSVVLPCDRAAFTQSTNGM